MTGGLIIGALVGVIVLVLIRVTGLELPTNLTPHYGIRLGLGILALTLAAFHPCLRTEPCRAGSAMSGPAEPPVAAVGVMTVPALSGIPWCVGPRRRPSARSRQRQRQRQRRNIASSWTSPSSFMRSIGLHVTGSKRGRHRPPAGPDGATVPVHRGLPVRRAGRGASRGQPVRRHGLLYAPLAGRPVGPAAGPATRPGGPAPGPAVGQDPAGAAETWALGRADTPIAAGGATTGSGDHCFDSEN